ncbi:unnamed protein product [Soboliphyme baturini]|uniref:Uncharacterized protein n=1 Tax=Soboliphyme baturini TaxID=241478 RepID=A0A183IIH7_9BILA|nr:unnamed protein product [Soboliphyme baturini]
MVETTPQNQYGSGDVELRYLVSSLVEHCVRVRTPPSITNSNNENDIGSDLTCRAAEGMFHCIVTVQVQLFKELCVRRSRQRFRSLRPSKSNAAFPPYLPIQRTIVVFRLRLEVECPFLSSRCKSVPSNGFHPT